MDGILYGVGVGPGNPKMLTLQAVEILQSADVIAVPDTNGEKTALRIVKDYIEDKELLFCPMPMSRDREVVDKAHETSCDKLERELSKGRNIAFITLGDPTVYSTYMYINRIISEKGYTTKIIPGITSFCASAGALNISLCDRDEALLIIPASYGITDELLALKGTKVFMKSGRSMASIKDKLKEVKLYDRAQMVECCSMENEKVYRSLDGASDDSSYFSTIIIKDK